MSAPMGSTTVSARAGAPSPAGSRIERALAHPVAYLATALVLLGAFGWTFFVNPDRVAPTKDPAYYSWRTEALLSEDPVTLLEIEGPKVGDAGGMFAGGYRVAAPVIGGFLRRIADIAPLSTTTFLMVGVPVLTALLLGAFAFQQRRDPLLFHSVALGAGSLYLTPPFVGYLDNILCLLFLAAALLFIEPSRDSWPARVGLALMVLMAGFTHPTTLVIFGLVLGTMAFVRLVFRRFDIRSVLRDDGPMLMAALAAAVITVVVWKLGIWGKSVPLGEAALPPPYDAAFFVERLQLWVAAMRPALNAPLFLIGAAGLLAAGRAAIDDELARTSVVWLAPLAGLFGFVGGLTYPYYRFFNTTLAWILLVGIGIYFAARFFIRVGRRGGVATLAYLGLVALIVIVATNFTTGYRLSGWTNAAGGWLSAGERGELDRLREQMTVAGDERPVVFVIDSEDTSPRVYGYTKLAGNTSRYGLPPGMIDEAYLYLGSVENFLGDRPTEIGEEIYDGVSVATLEEARDGIEEAGSAPIVVLASAFNETGVNSELLQDEGTLEEISRDAEIWVATPESIQIWRGGTEASAETVPIVTEESGPLHLLKLILGLGLLLVPGIFLLRWLAPQASFAEAVGLAPAAAAALLAVVGIVVLAIVRAPFTAGVAWAAWGAALLISAGLAVTARRRAPSPRTVPASS